MTASPAVLAAVKRLNHPIEAQAFLAAITEGEGGDLPNRLFGGGRLRTPENTKLGTDAKGRMWMGGLDAFPDWGGAWLTANGGGDFSTAAGVVQFTGTTWRRVVAITGHKTFSIEDQLENGWWLACDDFKRRSRQELLDCLKAGMLEMVHTYLGSVPKFNTWPGGAGSSFPRWYKTNMAALKAPPPQPPPIEIISITMPAEGVGVDASGRTVRIIYKTTTAIAMMLASAAVGGMIACVPPPPSQPDIRQQIATPMPSATEQTSGPASVFNKSTFLFVGGPEGLVVVPVRRNPD